MYVPTPSRHPAKKSPYQIPLNQRSGKSGTSSFRQPLTDRIHEYDTPGHSSQNGSRYYRNEVMEEERENPMTYSDYRHDASTCSSQQMPSYSQHTPSSSRHIPCTSSSPGQIHNSSQSSQVPNSSNFTSTKNGKWSPIGFAVQNLYNYDIGIPLDRETCEKNLQKLIRNHRKIDYYEYLELASKCRAENNMFLEQVCLAMGFNTAVLNECAVKADREVKKIETFSKVVAKRGFSLDEATDYDVMMELPSRKCFKLSDILSPQIVSHWTSSEFSVHLRSFARFVFDAIDSADPFFPCYSTSSSARTYIPLDPQLVSGITDFAIAAFGQEQTRDQKAYVRCLINSVIDNKLNRSRALYNSKDPRKSIETAIWMKKELLDEEGSQFPREILQFKNLPKLPSFDGTQLGEEDCGDDDEPINVEY